MKFNGLQIYQLENIMLLQEPQKRDKIIRSKFNKEYVNPT